MKPATVYQLRNARSRARGWKAELQQALGVGIVGTLSARVVRYEKLRDAALDHGDFGTLAAYQSGFLDAGVSQDDRTRFIDRLAADPRYAHCVERLGVLGKRVVTTAGVNFLTDAFQNTVEIELMNFHDSGTGTVAEAIGDTGLGTPTGEARNAGTQGEGASANIYQTVATHTYAGSFAITEHGIFSASTAGTLWDRTVFAAINVVSSDAIEFTYELTSNAGG